MTIGTIGTPPPDCDAHLFGAFPSVLDGRCRCLVCARCGHHTGNSHQGHSWSHCSVLAARVKASLAPGETLDAAEFVKRTSREFHFCCTDPAFGCELEPPAPAAEAGQP